MSNWDKYRDIISNYWQSQEIPINVLKFAREMDITVEPFEKIENPQDLGCIENIEGKWKIYYNSRLIKEGELRFNFTIAHEIGHFLLHDEIVTKAFRITDTERPDDRNPILRNDVQDLDLKKIEVEANRFAGSLLVPDWYVLKALNNSLRNFDTLSKPQIVKQASKDLTVSYDTASIKIFGRKYQDLT